MAGLNRKFESLAEAYEALPEKTKKHCERVGSYTRTIFLRAVAAEIYPSDQKVTSRLHEEYGDLAYAIGLYHDIGKAYLPEDLHFNVDLEETEVALYRKHIISSFELVNEFFKTGTEFGAYECNYAIEAIKSMHENWDGTGLPEGLNKRKIPVLARVLRIADALDNEVIKRHSENPFDEAMEEIMKGNETLFDPEIIDLLPTINGKLKKIYKQGIECTKTIPQIDAFVKRKTKRPVKLEYRTMVDYDTAKTVALEARPVFFIKKMNERKDYAYVEKLIKTDKKLLRDLCVYMVAEACDTLRRANACELDISYIVLNLPAGWLRTAGAAKEILSVISDEEIEPNKICIVADEIAFSGARTNLYKNTLTLKEGGVRVMASDVEMVPPVKEEPKAEETEETPKAKKVKEILPVVLPVNEFTESGFTMFRMCARDEERAEEYNYLEMLKELKNGGTEILADNLDADETASSLKFLEVKTVSGAIHGDFMFEDDVIKAGLNEQ